MRKLGLVVIVLALLLGAGVCYDRFGRSNAYYANELLQRFGTFDRFVNAIFEYEQAHGGVLPPSNEAAIESSLLTLSPGRVELDAETYRSLNRLIVLRDVKAIFPRYGALQFDWIVMMFVPEETLPNYPGYRKGEDCLYFDGRLPSGPNRYEKLLTVDDAVKAFGPDVVAKVRRRYEDDRSPAATQQATLPVPADSPVPSCLAPT